MPDSMFGRPSQHLLPSYPPASAAGSSVASDTAPVQPGLVSFKDFRFNSIGKQPELLSRISLPQPDHTGYHSSTPSPASTPPPTFTNDGVLQSKSFSRPTLFQQLAGSDFSSSMDEGLRWNASTSQSNRSLASRIQMNDSPSNDAVNTAPNTVSRFPSPASHVNRVRRAAEDASLIPPVEVLPQPPESSPTTPASALAPPLEAEDVHSPTSSTPLMNTTTTRSSRIPTPSVSTSVTSREPTEPFPSFAIVDAMMQDLQPLPSAAAVIDSLVSRQERLQAISANLANLASPLPPSSSSQSSYPDTSSVSRANDNITPHQSSQPQSGSTPIVLHHPYSVNQSSSRVGLIIDDIPANTNDSSLALVHSPTAITQEHQARHKAVIEAVQNLNSALSAAHRAQIDSENALAFQIRTFEEQRAAFEETKRAQEVTLLQEFQELQQKREELNAKEVSLASLERESKAREVARKTVLAKRQAQEEEKRATEAKKTQEVQEQIAAAMTEIKEIEVLRAKGRLEQLASETVSDDLPTEPQEGMDKEEITVIESRNDLLRAVKQFRRMHSDKVQKLEESNCTLRRLEEERKQREVKEAERRRIAEEERLRAHAEAEQARQVVDEKQRRLEAERKRQELENDREQARLSVEQQTYTEATSDETFKHRGHPEEVSASQQQGLADMTRIRAAPEANSLSPEVTTAMNVDEDGKASAPHRTAPLPDSHTNSGGSQNATSQSKQKVRPISGGVMLAASTPKASAGLPPKPSTKPPSLSTSDHVAENALKPARTSPAIIMSTEGGRRSSFPAQLASEFNRVVDASIRRTPDHKTGFPRTPKSQTLLDATIGGSEEFYIGPVTGFSPTQQNVNLRHLKRNRSRIDENDSGDRSVRTVKCEENSCASLKREEHDDQPLELVQASLSTKLPASLPPRPAIIPPPRPRKRHVVPASQIHSIGSYPPESNEFSSTQGEAQVTADEQPREALSRGNPSSQAMDASVQLPVPTEATNSLLLGPVYPESQRSELRIDVGEKATQDRAEDHDTAFSEPASATLSHELDGEDPSRSNRRFTDEHRRSRNGNKFRRLSDHHSPSSATPRSTAASPTSPYRYVDTWRPQNPSSGPRAETVRATSPTTGRKRPFEFHNNEHGHRARRQRDDVWIAEDDRDRVDSYRSHWDRRDSEPDERRASYRAPTSPSDRIWSYPSDIPRETNDSWTYIPPFSEEPTTQAARWEQSYRRSENDETYQRYQPSAPGYNAVIDLHHADDVGINQTYEPMTEARMDVQTDPSLLTRMSNTQRFPPSTNFRGRGRGEPNRGRGDFGRGRGRGVTRGTPALLERITSGPPSLGNRLS